MAFCLAPINNSHDPYFRIWIRWPIKKRYAVLFATRARALLRCSNLSSRVAIMPSLCTTSGVAYACVRHRVYCLQTIYLVLPNPLSAPSVHVSTLKVSKGFSSGPKIIFIWYPRYGRNDYRSENALVRQTCIMWLRSVYDTTVCTTCVVGGSYR